MFKRIKNTCGVDMFDTRETRGADSAITAY